MNRIEFIGASYVGKSTLYNALSSRLHNNDSYITEQDCKNVARKKMGLVQFLYRKILQKIIVAAGGNFVVYDIADGDHLKVQTIESYKNSLEICFRKDVILNQGIAIANKTYLFLLHLIARYDFYQKLVPNKTIVVEESFIHWHLIYQELMKIKMLECPVLDYSDAGLFPKAIIICYADEKTILERIKLREKDRKINANHLNHDHSYILNQVLVKQEVFLQHAKNAKSIDIDVLYINTAEDLQFNLTKIENFLELVKKTDRQLEMRSSG